MTFEHNLKNIEDENERNVAEFLNKLGFSYLASRSKFKKSEAEIAREIDLLFTYHQKREIELFGYWFLIQKEINNEVKLV